MGSASAGFPQQIPHLTRAFPWASSAPHSRAGLFCLSHCPYEHAFFRSGAAAKAGDSRRFSVKALEKASVLWYTVTKPFFREKTAGLPHGQRLQKALLREDQTVEAIVKGTASGPNRKHRITDDKQEEEP